MPLAGAEAYRNFRQRKIDWGMWAALAAGILPLLISLPAILHVVHGGLHPWRVALPLDYRHFYTNNFRLFVFTFPAALLLLVWLAIGGRKEKPAGTVPSAVRDYEWVAAALFLIAPLVAITLALLIPPHTYVDRYLAFSAAGFALLISFTAAQLGKRRAAIGAICAIAGFAPFASDFTLLRVPPQPDSFMRATPLRQALAQGDSPVVVGYYLTCLEAWFHAPEDLKPRILCLTDEQASLQYLHTDDADGKSLRALGVPFRSYREFATPGKQFVLYLPKTDHSWIAQKILADGGKIQPLASTRQGQIVRATVK